MVVINMRMIRIDTSLSRGFPLVRVDLYEVKGEVKFVKSH